jgi:hypothetical protein
MPDALWLALAGALCFSGMVWLALAMEVHWRQAVPARALASSTTRNALRGAGAGALLLALLACLAADRPSMAALVWVMLLAASACGVACVLSHWPQALARWVFQARPAAHRR